MAAYDSGKMMCEGSLSYQNRELETMFPYKTSKSEMENTYMSPKSDMDNTFKTSTLDIEKAAVLKPLRVNNADSAQMVRSNPPSEMNCHSESTEPGQNRYHAALRLQKVYKSFRTRRQLADCAVLVEQKWWKLLDVVELKRSSISFFDIERPETALSRWSRARTRVAKVGKGLSKDEKARKLALQHWLEAIDPRHRYGHNLQFYYVRWLRCDSKQPFFYWLDIGDGKEVNLERCPQTKLQQQCIKYLDPKEREAYEVTVENGKFVYKLTGKLLDTKEGPKDAKWIFVLSTTQKLYIGLKCKGTFQHSSFLAGGATLSAGRLVVEDGVLKAVWPHSGHYLPTEENFQEFMSFLMEHDVDLSNVKKSPMDGEEEMTVKKPGSRKKTPPETEISREIDAAISRNSAEENVDATKQEPEATDDTNRLISILPPRFLSKIKTHPPLEKTEVFDIPEDPSLPEPKHGRRPTQYDECAANFLEWLESSPTQDGYETAEEILSEEEFMFPKANLSDDEEEDQKPVPKDKIMRRIDSHKGMKSYQLAQQLSSKWSTGAGPRISCMRDYPSELQFKVLEQANLTPRGKNRAPTWFMTVPPRSSKVSNLSPLSKVSAALKSAQSPNLVP